MPLQTPARSAVLLVFLALGCSSSSSTKQDGGNTSEAGAPDGAVRKDVPKAGIDVAAGEAGGGPDLKGSGRDTGTDGTRDGRLGGDTPADAAKRDTGADRKSDGNQDVVDDPVPPDAALPTGTCASPIEIPYATQIDVMASNVEAEHILDFPCAANGADVVFRIRTDGPELVYADTFGTAWNTALLFSESCDVATPAADDGTVACSDDACGTTQSQAFAILPYGYHYLIVSGVGGASGPLKLHFEHAMLGNGPPVNLPVGSSTLAGTTSGLDSSRTCDMAGPKNSYWWATCPSNVGGPFVASTCNGTDWDSALVLQVPRLGDDGVTCAEDDLSCGVQATLSTNVPPGAGINVLSVTGHLMRAYGDYTLGYTRP